MSSESDTPSRHISQVIHADSSAVYEFAFDPSNLPKWAAGLAANPVTRVGDLLVVDSPMGQVTVRFVEWNKLGVLDHEVTLPSGMTVSNPMRVLAHPNGAEVVFTVRRIGVTDAEFQRDAEIIASDLNRLKTLMES